MILKSICFLCFQSKKKYKLNPQSDIWDNIMFFSHFDHEGNNINTPCLKEKLIRFLLFLVTFNKYFPSLKD